MSTKNIIRVVSIAIFMMFWLPWITVILSGCSGVSTLSYNGFELASSGVRYYDSQLIEPLYFLFVVPLSALLILLLSAIKTVMLRARLQIVTDFIGLLSLLLSYLGVQEFLQTLRERGSVEYKVEPSLWFTIFGFFAILIMAFLEKQRHPNDQAITESENND